MRSVAIERSSKEAPPIVLRQRAMDQEVDAIGAIGATMPCNTHGALSQDGELRSPLRLAVLATTAARATAVPRPPICCV